jgi:glutamate-5-semialdehyde dehydrogenase
LKTSELAVKAKEASRRLAQASTVEKDRALLGMADAIERRSGEILAENAEDIAEGRSKGLQPQRGGRAAGPHR